VLIDSLRRGAERHPAKRAIVMGSEELTYGELCGLAAQFANGLEAAGIGSGDRVVILLRNRPEFVISLYGVVGVGATAVLLDPSSRSHELGHASRDCQPRAIITDAPGSSRWREANESTPALDFTLVIGGDGHADEFWPFVRDRPTTRAWHAEGDRVATFQYSSGSTGRAKRIGRTHDQWLSCATALAAAVGFDADDVFLCVMPLFHSYGCEGLITGLEAGATMVLQEHVQPFALNRLETLRLARAWNATVLQSVPYMFDLLASAPGSEPLPSLRHCGCGGVPLPQATFRAFDDRFGIPIRQEYGSTETGKMSVNVDRDPRSSWASVGAALPGMELFVLGEDGEPVAAGTNGRIAIRTPGLTTDHPYGDADDSPFVGDLFLTGDVGRLDGEGRLTVTGRTKVFVEILGEKVDPAEVEEVLAEHPDVKESVVVGVADEGSRSPVLKAVVVCESPCREDELIGFCKERLSSFKVPSLIEFRDEIPRSQVGKILRKDLIS